jgi:hypothetical protein
MRKEQLNSEVSFELRLCKIAVTVPVSSLLGTQFLHTETKKRNRKWHIVLHFVVPWSFLFHIDTLYVAPCTVFYFSFLWPYFSCTLVQNKCLYDFDDLGHKLHQFKIV